MKTKLWNVLAAVMFLIIPFTIFGQVAPSLGVASSYAIFTGTGASFNNSGASVITGDIGSNTSAVVGFPVPGTVIGATHSADLISAAVATVVGTAYSDLTQSGTVLDALIVDNQVIKKGVWVTGGMSSLNGTLILDAENDPNAVFIIRIGGAFSTGTGANVSLINQASLCNVFWQVNGAFSLGTGATFRGTVIAVGAIELLEGSALYGRGLSTAGAIALHNNVVTVNSPPAASVISAGGATAFCAGGSVVLSGNTSGGTWNTGATTTTITVTTAGDYYVTNTTACGAATSNHITTTINPLPSAVVISAGSTTTLCLGNTVTLSGNSGGTWSNAATSTSITVSAAGDYYVTTTNGCGSAISNHITVTSGVAPTASVISAGASATTFCAGGNVILTGNVGGTWSNGATTASTNITTSGDYYVTNSNVCGSVTSNHIAVTVNPLPTASVITAGGTLALCTGASVTLSGNVGGTWSNAATTASIVVTAAGDYFVTNTNGCGSVTSNHKVVTMTTLPTASVISTASSTTFCAGNSIVLTGNTSGTWSNAATTASTTITTAGDYFVTNTNGCGSVTSNHIAVTVNPLPIASVISASGTITVCAGNSVLLLGNNGGTWSNAATTATSTITTAGDYFVTNTNSCGTVTSNHINVTINPLPIASVISASGTTTFCAGNNVILLGNNAGTWSNAATTASTTITTTGDYFVTNTNGCGSVTSNHIAIVVNPLPTTSVISASGTTTFCAGNNVILLGNVGGTWSNTTSTASTTITTSGDYFVTNTNACGTTTSNHINVTVNPLPIASVISASGTTTFCAGNNVILLGNNAGTWSNAVTTASATISTAGDFFVTNTNGCGSVTSNHIAVVVNSLPTASVISASGTTTFCAGKNIILLGNVGGIWSNTVSTASTTITTSGDYFVTNTNACGTTTSNHINVVVNPLPVASVVSASGTTTFCVGNNVILLGNNAGTWSNAVTTATTTITTAGDYFVTNTNGCGSVTSNHIVVTVNSLPTASVISASGTTTFCAGKNIILLGNVGGIWSNTVTTASTTITTSGDYFVTNTNACGTTTSNHINVVVNPLPIASVISASGTTTFCTGNNVILLGNNAGTWSNAVTTATTTITTAGDYFVTNTNGCGSVTSNHIAIVVNPLPTASVISASGTTTFCSGNNVILLGNVGGTWSNTASTASTTITIAGDYFVTNTNGCGSATSNHIIVTVNPLPIASVISASGTTTICEGTSVILLGNNGGTWSNAATTASTTIFGAGNYFVTNTNGCGNVTSNHIVIVVNPTTLIIAQPIAQTACNTSSVVFSVAATGASLTYQWRKGNVNLVNSATVFGVNSSILTINPVEISDAATNYNVIVSGACTSITSVNVALVVNIIPNIVVQPISKAVCNGTTVNFSIEATGTGILYRWRKGNVNLVNGGNISGATSSTLTITSVTSADAADNYNVVITRTCLPNETSNYVSLVVYGSPIISTQPINQRTIVGSFASFSVVSTGVGYTYQWFRGGTKLVNGGNISGATTVSLTINPVSSSDTASNYYVVVSGPCSQSTTSANVVLSTYNTTDVASMSSENSTNAVSIYPNPFHSSINFKMNDDSNMKNCQLNVYDVYGKVVLHSLVTNDITTIETSNLPVGVYFYKVMDNNKTIQSGKMIAQ